MDSFSREYAVSKVSYYLSSTSVLTVTFTIFMIWKEKENQQQFRACAGLLPSDRGQPTWTTQWWQ